MLRKRLNSDDFVGVQTKVALRDVQSHGSGALAGEQERGFQRQQGPFDCSRDPPPPRRRSFCKSSAQSERGKEKVK